STGFGTGGALVMDIVTMKANITPNMEVKASGGIKTLEQAEAMIKAGATRIGTSSGAQIVEDYLKKQGEEA
ncbi:MAG: 2-deoxyribose-5-phosphate aldolase, partial [Bacilli bacterium]|nr:2-deoxyribose-5-phosphate aldolase [Bacilli bacterium]